MRPRQRLSAELLKLAELQAGTLSAEQIAGHDLSRRSVDRLLSEGACRRIATGLIHVGPEQPSWLGLAWGGILLGGDHARLGGSAAGHLWELADEPELITVLVPPDRIVSNRGSWRFIRERAGLRRPSRSSPPRTAVEDTVIDMCSELDETGVIDLVTKAVQQRRTRPDRILRRVNQYHRVRHRQLLEDLLTDVSEGAESALELAYLNDVERAHGLPRGERQSRSGRNIHDVRYRDYGVLVELDGRLGHEGTGRFRDMQRDNLSLVRGDLTLRYGWADVNGRCCSVARQVASVLVPRGWIGPLSTCQHCNLVPIADLGVA